MRRLPKASDWLAGGSLRNTKASDWSNDALASAAPDRCDLPTMHVSQLDDFSVDWPVRLLVQASLPAWTREQFVKRYGAFPQFAKNELVRPIDQTSISTREAVERIGDSERNLLLFTNDVENSAFFRALGEEMSTPPQLRHVEAAGFRLLSAGAAGSSHSLHQQPSHGV